MFRNHFARFIINEVFFLKKFHFQKRYLNLLYILLKNLAKSYSCLRAHYYYIRTQLLTITQINYLIYNYYLFANNV